MHIANDTYHVRTYERTDASSTVSRHSGAETKINEDVLSEEMNIETILLAAFCTILHAQRDGK